MLAEAGGTVIPLGPLINHCVLGLMRDMLVQECIAKCSVSCFPKQLCCALQSA